MGVRRRPVAVLSTGSLRGKPADVTRPGELEGREVRASDDERNRITDQLGFHCAAGRITVEELQVTFTEPQVAAVGLTEQTAHDAGIDVQIVSVGTSANAGGTFWGTESDSVSGRRVRRVGWLLRSGSAVERLGRVVRRRRAGLRGRGASLVRSGSSGSARRCWWTRTRLARRCVGRSRRLVGGRDLCAGQLRVWDCIAP